MNASTFRFTLLLLLSGLNACGRIKNMMSTLNSLFHVQVAVSFCDPPLFSIVNLSRNDLEIGECEGMVIGNDHGVSSRKRRNLFTF